MDQNKLQMLSYASEITFWWGDSYIGNELLFLFLAESEKVEEVKVIITKLIDHQKFDALINK